MTTNLDTEHTATIDAQGNLVLEYKYNRQEFVKATASFHVPKECIPALITLLEAHKEKPVCPLCKCYSLDIFDTGYRCQRCKHWFPK